MGMELMIFGLERVIKALVIICSLGELLHVLRHHGPNPPELFQHRIYYLLLMRSHYRHRPLKLHHNRQGN